MKSKKDVIKDVVKPTSISPRSSFTDPNEPWSAKANVAENITSKRSNLLQQFYKSKGWNVNYIAKNKKVSQSKTGDFIKWKRDHGIYEEDQIDEVSNELLGRYKTAAGQQASNLDKAGGRENIQKANKRFSGIVKATKKQFANDEKPVAEAKDEGEYDYDTWMKNIKKLHGEVKIKNHPDRSLAKAAYNSSGKYVGFYDAHGNSKVLTQKDLLEDTLEQGVAEGSLNESDKFTSWYDWKDQAKSSGYTITKKDDKIVSLNKQGQVVGHWSDVGKFLSGKAPRPNFKRPEEQGVAEGSEQEKPIKKSDWFDPTDMRSPEKQKAAYLNHLAAQKQNKNIKEQGVAEGSTNLASLRAKASQHSDKIDAIVKDGGRVGLNDPLSKQLKLIQAKIQQAKKQVVVEAKDEGEYDYEGAMAKTQLQTICRAAAELKDILKDDENLPEWVQSKITKAEDYITTSLDYLKSTNELEEEINLDEALSKNSTAYNFIHDFVHSDNPKFDGKSKAQRMQMALAAYYAMQKRSRTKNEEVEPIEELNKDTLYSYVNKSEKDQDKQFTTIGKALKNKIDAKSGNAAGHKFTRRSLGINRAEKRLEQEGVGDPQAATQSPADGANGGEEVAPRKTTKKIVKEFYALARKVQEDMYDWEKDDKAAKPYGKKPSVKKYDGVENMGDNKPNARLILKGGKTLTGEPRDTVEIDPMMKNRSKMPDYKSMDKIKQKPQEQ